jgi:hypothetical protein
MALANMKVFNDYVRSATIETLAQMVDKFNAASRGAIRLSTEGFGGDFLMESSFASLHSARRRVDRYATNADANATPLSQLQHNSVKVAGGFGPILWEPSQLSWVQQNPAAAVEVISRNMSEAIMQDMLNTAIAALVAAIEAQGSATVADGGTGPVTYSDINNAHAKFGDHSGLIVANVMDGATYHGLIGQNLANAERLFQAQGVLVVDVLGRAVVVTDAPALRETGTGADAKVLGLVTDAAVVHDANDLITNIETSNGKERIETTMQADYTFGLGLKGYAWDTAEGGKSPTDAELATGGNWDKIATNIKHTAGVLAVADI